MTTPTIIRLFPSLFSIPSVIYWYNDNRHVDIFDDPKSFKLTTYRALYPFSPVYQHIYERDFAITKEQNYHLIEFETKHPVARAFVRPFCYADKIPYPKLIKVNPKVIE